MPIVINGSGTVTGISAGGLPDGVIVQADLATGVAGTGPAFAASDTATTATSGVATKIVFDTEIFDTDNAFDGTKFQPSVAGYYILTLRTTNGVNTNAGTISSVIYKNGSGISGTSSVAYYAAGFSITALSSVVAYLNGSTDYIEFYGANTGNANLGVAYASAALVRAA